MTLKKYLLIVGAVFGISATAYAFPWDIDLVDAIFYRGYEWRMPTTPEGAVSQNNYRPFKMEPLLQNLSGTNLNILYPAPPMLQAKAKEEKAALQASQQQAKSHYTELAKTNKSAKSMTQTGEHMFDVYCVACHGKDGMGNAPLTWTKRSFNKAGKDVKRWQAVPVINEKLSCQSDGELYLTIRNGRNLMPGYGHAMEDREIWALIHYTREGLKRPYDPTAKVCQ